MPRYRYLVALGAIGAFLGSLPAEAADANEPITIGLIEPYTGDEAVYGQWVDDAWTLAMETYGNTIQGHPIKLVRADSKCEPTVAVSAGKQVLAQKPALLIAPVCSGDTLAIMPMIRSNELPTLSDNIAPKITAEGGGWVWRVQITDSVITPPLAHYMLSKGYQHIGVMHDTSAPGQGTGKTMIDALTAGGRPPAAVATYALSDTDHSGPLLKMKAANLDALFIEAYDTQGARIMKEVRQLGFNIPIFGHFSMFDETFIKGAGDAGNGLTGVTSYAPDWSEAAKKFEEQWFKRFNYHTQSDIAALYEMAVAAITALQKAPNARGKELNEIIAHTNIPNLPLGTLSFDSTGNNANPLVLLVTWKNEKLEVLQVLKGGANG